MRNLSHLSARLSQEVDTRLNEPTSSAMDLKMDIPTDDHGLTSSSSHFRWALATCHAAHPGTLFSLNSPFFTIPPPPVILEGIRPISADVFDSPDLFQNPSATPHGFLIPIALVSRFKRQILPGFQELWVVVCIDCSKLDKSFPYRKLEALITLRNELWGTALE